MKTLISAVKAVLDNLHVKVKAGAQVASALLTADAVLVLVQGHVPTAGFVGSAFFLAHALLPILAAWFKKSA